MGGSTPQFPPSPDNSHPEEIIPTANTINRQQNCIICWRISQLPCSSCTSSLPMFNRQKL